MNNSSWLKSQGLKNDRIGKGIDSNEGSTWHSVYALVPKAEAGPMLSPALIWAPTPAPCPSWGQKADSINRFLCSWNSKDSSNSEGSGVSGVLLGLHWVTISWRGSFAGWLWVLGKAFHLEFHSQATLSHVFAFVVILSKIPVLNRKGIRRVFSLTVRVFCFACLGLWANSLGIYITQSREMKLLYVWATINICLSLWTICSTKALTLIGSLLHGASGLNIMSSK